MIKNKTNTNILDTAALTGSTAIDCPDGFSLEKTLMGGQCFRWQRQDELFFGVALGRFAIMRQSADKIEIWGGDSPDSSAVWGHYLDFSLDYNAVRAEVTSLEPRLRSAAERCGGVHILNQQPWEAFCAFVISQNNNIPRIRGIISRLCELCGEPITTGLLSLKEKVFAFPSPRAVAQLTIEQLEGIGCGYRAAYIKSAAECALDGRFDPEYLARAPIGEARAVLQSIHGVGAKVADCVLLYGLHRLDAFPRDVWIKRALEGDFSGTPLMDSRYAGVAQQYIFEYMRGN